MNITEQLKEIDILVCRLRAYSTMSEFAYVESSKLAAITEIIKLLYEISAHLDRLTVAAEKKELDLVTDERKARNSIPF